MTEVQVEKHYRRKRPFTILSEFFRLFKDWYHQSVYHFGPKAKETTQQIFDVL